MLMSPNGGWNLTIGGIAAFVQVQILAQAIEKAGTLDRDEVKKVLDTETFDTTLGPARFEKFGVIRQWSYCGETGPGNGQA